VLQGAAVDEEGVPGPGQSRRHLVHDAAGHAHEAVLGPLTQPRQVAAVDPEAGGVLEGAQRRYLQGG